MDKDTLKATKGSIKKWKNIAEGKGVDKGPENCPLCKSFFSADCAGCPVMDKTGRRGCLGTPYIEWDDHHRGIHFNCFDLDVKCPECKEIALKEVAFLKSLLPEKKDG